MNIKKLLSLLLSAAMISAASAVTVFADETYEAEIGGTQYPTLADAVSNADTGDTVKLLNDVSVTGKGIDVVKSITFDFAGKNVTGTAGMAGYGAFNIYGEGVTVTFNGEGSVIDTSGLNYTFYIGDNASIIINSGKYHGSTGGCIFAQLGDVAINGGTFSCNAYRGNCFVLNKLDTNKESCNFVVKGGTFINLDPSANNNENPAENQVADGYKVVSETIGSDTYYTVVKDLGEAVAFTSEEDTSTTAGYFFNVTKAVDEKTTAVATFSADNKTLEKTLDLSSIDGEGSIAFSILLVGAPEGVTGNILYK